MRLRRLRAHVFGALRGRELELPAESVLVFGPNESGKSTFRAALETILYGFDPADRELHPLARWEAGAAGNLHLEAELDLATGRVRVERELLARPGLRIAEGSAPFAGPRAGNLPLECTSGVPREVFRGVYSLELGELSALGERTRAHVDALLLPQLAALGLRPPGEVRAELAGDHRCLWRPDRLAKRVVAREKEEEIAQLREDARKAAAEEQALREARVEQAALEGRVKALREQRDALARALEDAPLLASLAELERRRRGLGAPIDLSALEGLPLVDPESLAAEIAQLEQETALPAARLEREAESLSEPERRIQALLPEIAAALGALPDQRADRQRLAELRERAADLTAGMRRELTSVLARAPGHAELAAALAVPCEALRAAHSSWAEAWERHARGSAGQAPRGWLAAAAAAIALGLAGLLVEPLSPQLPPIAPPIAFGLGLLCLVAALLLPRRAPPEPSLGDLLSELAPPPPLFSSPAELSRLIERIERVQTSSAGLESVQRAARSLEQSLAAREACWQELGRRLGWTGAGEALLGRLAAARDQLLARTSRVEEDRRERQSASERIAALAPLLERKRAHARLLHEALRAAEPGAATDAIAHQAVTRRLAEAEFVQRREAELGREPRHSVLSRDPRLLAESAQDDWSPGAIEQGRRDLARLNDELEAATTRQGEIRTQLAGAPGSRQAKIADEIQEAREELAAAKRARDRLALLESIVVRAERSFRDQHQPDVLRRAGLYLERVTGGRWRRLDREEDGGGRLLVTGGERSHSVPAEPPLSRGALDQIFLCLRLGLLDHLDEGRERLPLILDDALLRTDDARRRQIYPLLAEVSRQRQVFLLTCQDWIASEAEQMLRVRRISLAP